MEQQKVSAAPVITPSQALAHWQGHRGLTRRVIDAFPEDQLFSYALGGMRTFGELAMELNRMAATGAHGIATGEWKELLTLTEGVDVNPDPRTKQDVLKLWDWSTGYINNIWVEAKPERFQETDNAFGQWEGPIWWHLLYFIDNEVHHRGQGYVYLRTLGIEPPPFWNR